MIDLLSGRSGQGVTSGRLRGVVFYATLGAGLPSSIGQEGWYVMDMQKRIVSKNRSPLCEADAFVLFDEARCRCCCPHRASIAVCHALLLKQKGTEAHACMRQFLANLVL